MATQDFFLEGGSLANYTEINCSIKDTIVLPTKVDGEFVTWINEYLLASAWCKNIIIPPSVTTIWSEAFSYNQLTSISIPNSVTSIWEAAFNNNQLPDNQAIIYKRNSDGSIDTTTIISYWWANKIPTIPSNVTNIWKNAFSSILLTSITIPNHITEIGGYAFANNKLESISIPDSVTTIWNQAFYNNVLTSITIPNNVTNLWIAVFLNNKITSFTLPNNMTTIPSVFF